ncbi:MAG TPA: tripartite tricarboxylate transporter substrate binding protein [Xanthobacteraceae bacterium]|jgi:tripartite-type tricarboxylate transporter receptor subunit TctC
MNLQRRHFLQFAAGAAAFPNVMTAARAQAYPTKPVRLITGVAAGGPVDSIVRLIGQWLSERLGQQFVIENRAGRNIATEAVVRAAPDGYTLLHVSAANAINARLYDKLDYDLLTDIAPVASWMRIPGVMEVNPAVPARTVPEFIAYAKANPGKIKLASAGIGTVPHLYGELFKMMAGVELVTVQYRGSSAALPDLISGQVQVMFDPLVASIGPIRDGTLRPLAVTTAARSPLLPELPTIGEFVAGYEASGWQGMAAPRNTPADIVETLNREINAGLADEKLKARLAELGGTPFPGTPAGFRKLIADDVEKWGNLIRSANIKPE